MDYYQIGQRIRKMRKACGLSQEELAEKVDISTTHMSHIETGNTKLSLPVLVRIADVLEVRTDDLLTSEPRDGENALPKEISEVLDRCTAQEINVIAEVIKSIKRSMDKFLCVAVLLIGLFLVMGLTAEVKAEGLAESETSFYDPEDERLTHLELLEKLCTGFPYVGYERFPDFPQYFQQDYPNTPYGGYGATVATCGCGVSSLAILASYLTDTPYTPADMAEIFARYGTPVGTNIVLFDDCAAVLGFQFRGRALTAADALEALETGHIVVSLQTEGPFTSAAHFIVLMGLTEDGKIMIKDPNIFNHTVRFAGTDYFENGFPVKTVTGSGWKYWVYEPKVVRFPGCDRCADPEVETAPVFLETYYCAKCTALRNRQSTYHEIMEAIHEKPEI